MIASVLASVIGLQIGSFFVAVQTLASGVTELPFGTFLIFMQPIHLAIGIVEGIVTGLVLNFIYENRPDILEKADIRKAYKMTKKKVISIILVVSLFVAGGISLLASSHPDGLEWSILKTSGSEELSFSGDVHERASEVQNKTSFLLDYGFKSENLSKTQQTVGNIVAGVVGVIITIGVVVSISYISTRRSKVCAVDRNIDKIEDKYKDK